ncbi:DUF2018 family protein [Helicobacter mustelae]|uniref:DUF2018 domain-containing protein n=1 Tax=Helicobacter mustelae (strain ATCC 43772 / CCUG 25715 / CIP 103759 / LMG 18044 / NCTC 12198 / R85-136P) TaxID=679897 RepID=D3UJ46_HELM1|nr:DUF2018 family protein [Helicobacter mustelae]CBG40521.1 Putative hypothetical protein [Helicobacter mustelae 12198]SQH72019.1 Domain of uncharacterised function (DUF2018) [Helicobacter mustelae]STP13162.1 Domain of uncharacterised function (DUF2018) [Helicobacter mustelae]
MWEDLEVLQGDPLQKWREIVFHANRNIAEKQLDLLLTRVAIVEKILQEADLEERYSKLRRQLGGDQELQSEIHARKVDLAIESMASILSENE